jgi:origin recognition complex subunit 2
LLHGYGSKRGLLGDFAAQCGHLSSKQVQVCEVQGYDKDCSVSLLIDKLFTNWLGWSEAAVQAERRKSKAWHLKDRCEALLLHGLEDMPLMLVIHSLDMLCDQPGVASALALLASSPHIYLVASTDHVHSPMLFSQQDAARFNWIWHETNTFQAYDLETNHYTGFSAQGGLGSRGARGAAYVLNSVTPNHLSVLKEMAKLQLKPGGEDGIEHRKLLEICVQNMWVNSDAALGHYLEEFIDHELVVSRKGADGVERLVVNLDPLAIQKEILQHGER